MWLILQQDPLLETHCDVVKKCCKQALTIEHLVALTLPRCAPHTEADRGCL